MKTDVLDNYSAQGQKEELHNRIIQLEKRLDAKQALELEIEQLRGTLNVMKHMGDNGDVEVLKKVETLLKELKEKEAEHEDLEALNQTLIIQQRKSNDELQDARKELISVSFSPCWTIIHGACCSKLRSRLLNGTRKLITNVKYIIIR